VANYLNFNDPLLITYRKGTTDDPYVDRSDSLKIVNNIVSLHEIPDKFNHVVIEGYTEIDRDLGRAPNSTEFVVDYQVGIIFFNGSEEGKTISAIYKGRGYIKYPAERIYVHNENPDLAQNIQELIDNGQAGIEALQELGVAIVEAQEITEEANELVDSLNASEAIRVENENDRIEKEDLRLSNEEVREEAEDIRIYSENTRIARENNRENAEEARELAESVRVDSENDRNDNEDVRQSQESTRQSQESTRQSQESARQTNEGTRNTSETARLNTESDRVIAEQSRVNAEDVRVSSENDRIDAEESRDNAESIRETNEETRQTQESTRQSQESDRQTNTATAITNTNTQATYAKNQGDYAKSQGNALVFKGEYDPETAYVPNNVVRYEGSVYVNTVASTGIVPTNTANWGYAIDYTAYFLKTGGNISGDTDISGNLEISNNLTVNSGYLDLLDSFARLTRNSTINTAALYVRQDGAGDIAHFGSTTLEGKLKITNSGGITASGDISTSGNITTTNGYGNFTRDHVSSSSLYALQDGAGNIAQFGSTSDQTKLLITNSGGITAKSNITTIGNISTTGTGALSIAGISTFTGNITANGTLVLNNSATITKSSGTALVVKRGTDAGDIADFLDNSDASIFKINSSSITANKSTSVNGSLSVGTGSGNSLNVGGKFYVDQNGSDLGTSGVLRFVTGYASPSSGKLFIGDGTGWNFTISSKHATSGLKDIVTFYDSGEVVLSDNLTVGTVLETSGTGNNTMAGSLTVSGGDVLATGTSAKIGFNDSTVYWINVSGVMASASSIRADGNLHLNSQSGTISFGTGSDVNLYRNGANQLKTDDTFIVGGNAVVSGGTLALDGTGANQISFVGNDALSDPTSDGRSVGTKIMLYDNGISSNGIGVNAGYVWYSAFDSHKWFTQGGVGGTPTTVMSLEGNGDLTVAGNIIMDNTATQSYHVVNKEYVDNAIAGLDQKTSVRVIARTDITLSGLQTIDGVTLVAGNRVLKAANPAVSSNGIYIVQSGTWTRATDADISAEVTSGLYVFVEEGTQYGGSGWILNTPNPITLGTTGLNFVQFSQAGVILAGTGLVKSGNTLSLDVSGVTGGTYNTVTVDTYGRVTSASNTSYAKADGSVAITGNQSIAGLNVTGQLATLGSGWNESIRLTSLSNSMIIQSAGQIGFGMHSNRNFYWHDVTNAIHRMTLDGANGNLTVSGTGTFTGGTLTLNNGTSNVIVFNNVGVGAPTSTGGIGQKLSLYGANSLFGIGVESGATWYASQAIHKWYTNNGVVGTTPVNVMTLSGTGSLTLKGGLTSINDIAIDTTGTTQPSMIYLMENGTPKWSIGKKTDNDFSIFNMGLATEALKISAADNTVTMDGSFGFSGDLNVEGELVIGGGNFKFVYNERTNSVDIIII
jgi:hypothetical protein